MNDFYQTLHFLLKETQESRKVFFGGGKHLKKWIELSIFSLSSCIVANTDTKVWFWQVEQEDRHGKKTLSKDQASPRGGTPPLPHSPLSQMVKARTSDCQEGCVFNKHDQLMWGSGSEIPQELPQGVAQNLAGVQLALSLVNCTYAQALLG